MTTMKTTTGASRRLGSLATAVAALALFLPAPTAAQEADPADVATLDDIMAALYDVISGPAAQTRDWDRFRSLFIPDGARLVPSGRGQQGARYQVWTPDEYIENAGASLEQNGFFEREIGRTTEEFGNVVHVFSAYDSKRTLDDPEPFARGINSIQLFHDGTRYWIVTIFWDSERPGNQIPARYIND